MDEYDKGKIYAIIPEATLSLSDALQLIRRRVSIAERRGMRFLRQHRGEISIAYVRTSDLAHAEYLRTKVPECLFEESMEHFDIT